MASSIDGIAPAFLTALGWALIHFLWQGAAITALAAALIQISRKPQTRYLVGVLSLAVLLAAPITTFFYLRAAVPDAIFLALPVRNAIAARLAAFATIALPLLVEAWAAGVILLSLRFIGSALLLERACRRQSRLPGATLLALCHEVQTRLGITRAIAYLECCWLEAPAGFGFLRPLILLPAATLLGLSETQLRAVIAHELAHIRRWDFAVNLFQIVAGTLLFYHPAVWWLNRRIRAEREICCDDMAVSACGNRVEYARALTFLAQLRSTPSLAMAANRGVLSDRVLRLLHGDVFDARALAAGLLASLLLLMVSLTGGDLLLARSALPHPIAANVTPSVHIAATPRLPRKMVAAIRFRIRPPSGASLMAMLPVVDAPDEPSAPALPSPIPVADSQPLAGSDGIAEALETIDNYYPAPSLTMLAQHTALDWERPQFSNYCGDYAEQIVEQGANRPIKVDPGSKQRFAFFYWNCMLANGQIAGDQGPRPIPPYQPVGAASTLHPVDAAGTWAISFPPWGPTRRCSFTQAANLLHGTCSRGDGITAARGTVDGRQLRLSWTYLDDEQLPVEVDFLGLVQADGVLAGQAITFREQSPPKFQSFTATLMARPQKMLSQNN